MSWLLAGYRRTLGGVLDHPWLALLVLLAVVGLNVHLYGIVPKGFFPQQDTGYIFGTAVSGQDSSSEAI